MALIDKKHVSSADKPFYLKKYVSGPARKTLEGAFYRNDNDAWSRLNSRITQKAFREKLANWPKISPKDVIGLREFSDFLNACQDAMSHVKGLHVLNDCQENQKLVQKLLDWAISRWNRRVTQALSQNQEFPTFQEFATLVATETEIACNPITSFYALHSSDTVMEKQNLKDSNGEKVRVFNTQTNSEDQSETERQPERPPCAFCQYNNHQIYNCTKFTDTDLEERRKFVQERRLCYGCLRPGHSARDCRHQHPCNICKGKHPTSLHDGNYVKQTKASPSVDPQRVSNEARSEEHTSELQSR